MHTLPSSWVFKPFLLSPWVVLGFSNLSFSFSVPSTVWSRYFGCGQFGQPFLALLHSWLAEGVNFSDTSFSTSESAFLKESDLARVLGSLMLEGEKLGEVVVPDIAYDRVEEKYQYSLVVKVLSKRRFHVQTLKDTIRGLWGGSEGVQVLDMGGSLFHVIFLDDVKMLRPCRVNLGYLMVMLY
ncbi:hypothetical protein LIER_18592 [Lithospermum erythrorhizon]|uniref:Uncharacterized protein n=1 Tax=Lithospermum erythrorhizon TaxID=34254 RepID=A0AAV3QIR0_LITER